MSNSFEPTFSVASRRAGYGETSKGALTVKEIPGLTIVTRAFPIDGTTRVDVFYDYEKEGKTSRVCFASIAPCMATRDPSKMLSVSEKDIEPHIAALRLFLQDVERYRPPEVEIPITDRKKAVTFLSANAASKLMHHFQGHHAYPGQHTTRRAEAFKIMGDLSTSSQGTTQTSWTEIRSFYAKTTDSGAQIWQPIDTAAIGGATSLLLPEALMNEING